MNSRKYQKKSPAQSNKHVMYPIFISLIVLTLISCSKKKDGKASENAKLVFTSNMDCFDCWANTNTLKQGIAHSGRFSSRLDSTVEFSYSFVQQYKNLNSGKAKKVNVKIWGYFPNADIRAQLVISIDSVNKNKFWESAKLDDKIKNANTWTEVTFSAALPLNISENDVLKVYVWNPKKRTFYVDDMEVSFD